MSRISTFPFVHVSFAHQPASIWNFVRNYHSDTGIARVPTSKGFAALVDGASRCYNACRNLTHGGLETNYGAHSTRSHRQRPSGTTISLYEKTQDAMVAFELARVFETASQNAEAAKWYSTAASRFRRADWKTKAQEAATRLGGESIPDSQLDFPQLVLHRFRFRSRRAIRRQRRNFDAYSMPSCFQKLIGFESESDSESDSDSESQPAEAAAKSATSDRESVAEGGRRRRGRRGGRNRRKGATHHDCSSSMLQRAFPF